MSELDLTVRQLLDKADEWGSPTAKLIYSDSGGTPLWAVIAVHGPETTEVLAAIDAVEKRWEEGA